MSAQEASCGPVLLVHACSGGAALLWSAAEARDLRERHGIAGSPAGALARQPRQNSRLGLPVVLMAEEARLLAETGAAVLARPATADVSGEEIERRVRELEEERERGFVEQRRLAAQERRDRMRSLAATIARGREAKRRKPRGGRDGCGGETRGKGGVGGGETGDIDEAGEGTIEEDMELLGACGELGEDAGEKGEGAVEGVKAGEAVKGAGEEASERGEQNIEEAMEACADPDASEEAAEDKAATADEDNDDVGLHFSRESMLVQLPTARLAARPLRQVEWRSASALWPHPGRPLHELRYRVYRDLRRRGLYITSGAKFGGDFLVYPGDPLRFHSHFIALCRDDERPMPLVELLAAARLGTNVKKTVLLCSPLPGDGVRYTSLQWSGWK